MSNGFQRSVSKNQKIKSALERVEALENGMSGMGQAVQQMLNQLNLQGEFIGALVGMMGPEKVQQAIEEARLKRLEENSRKQKADLEMNVSRGIYNVVDVVSEKSTLVGVETQKDETVVPPGRVQVEFKDLKPEYREKLLGKGFGIVVETDQGSFELLEVYDYDQAKADEVAKAMAAEQAAANMQAQVEATQPPATDSSAADQALANELASVNEAVATNNMDPQVADTTTQPIS